MTDSAVVDLRLWGKERGLGGPRYPVVCHGLDAAVAVRALWHEFVSPSLRRRLAAALGLSDSEACSLLEFWASLHDIGKISPSFAHQLEMPTEFAPTGKEPALRHDAATHLWLPTGLASLGYPCRTPRSVGRLVAQLLGGHHGRFHDFGLSYLRSERLPGQGLGHGHAWEAERTAMLAVLQEVIAPPTPDQLPVEDAALVAGMVVLADWLVSQTEFVRTQLPRVPEVGNSTALAEFFQGSLEPVRALVQRAGLTRLQLRSGTFAEEFPEFRRPNTLQTSIASELPEQVTGAGLLMVAAPMGFGKTETALHAARIMGRAAGTSGMFVALPTMATADQMFTRIARYLARRGDSDQPASQTLLHGMAWLSPVEETLAAARVAEGVSSDIDAQLHAAEWLRGAKRGLLAGVGVGTIDQALLAMLPVRHNALRLFSLAGKTVVIDEVHAFDEYMRGLLTTLLGWLGELGVPVVLLSATLPQAVATELSCAYTGTSHGDSIEVPYPGWRYVERDREPVKDAVSFPDERRRPIEFALCGITTGADRQPDRLPVLQDVLAPVADQGCAAVICTTVAQAQDTYTRLQDWAAAHGVQLHLLHSRFPLHQREETTQRMLGLFGKPDETSVRPQRTVVVATQVIEQSLDVDFDLVVSDLAPIELLLQRSGRLQRHPAWDAARPAWADPTRGGRRRMVVLTAPERDPARLPRAWSFIYPQASLVRAHELLRSREHEPIQIPDDVQNLVDRGNPGKFPDLDDELLADFAEAELERSAQCMVKAQTAHRVAIDQVSALRSLAGLSDEPIDDEQATTRFNADSVRALPVFTDEAGTLRIGGPNGEPLPEPEGGNLTREHAIAVMRHTIPVSGSLVRDRDDSHALPEPWAGSWPLNDLVVLWHQVDATGAVHPAAVGRRRLLLDPELGLTDQIES